MSSAGLPRRSAHAGATPSSGAVISPNGPTWMATDGPICPTYRRVVARPRLFWEDGRGKSLLLAVGGMAEERKGGTMPGSRMPDGLPFEENLETNRFDSGAVLRMATANGIVFSARGSGTQSGAHAHLWARDRARHAPDAFGEFSATGTAGRHTWVAGGALHYDRYDSRDVPRFNYTYHVPGVFVQDDLAAAKWATISASARVDRHNEFGTFASPRISVLAAAGQRLDGPRIRRARLFRADAVHGRDRGHGLSRIAPLGTAGCGARRQLLGRRDLGAHAVRGDRHLLLLAHRWRARRRRDRPPGLSHRDRQLRTGSREPVAPN